MENPGEIPDWFLGVRWTEEEIARMLALLAREDRPLVLPRLRLKAD